MAHYKEKALPTNRPLRDGDTYWIKPTNDPKVTIYKVGPDGIPYVVRGVSVEEESKLLGIEDGAQKNPPLKTLNGFSIIGDGNLQIPGGDYGGYATNVIPGIPEISKFYDVENTTDAPLVFGNFGGVSIPANRSGKMSFDGTEWKFIDNQTDLSNYAKTGQSPNLFDKGVRIINYNPDNPPTMLTRGIIWGAYMGINGEITPHDRYFITDFIDLMDTGERFTYTANSDIARDWYIRLRTIFDAQNIPQPGSGSIDNHNQFSTGYPKCRLSLYKEDLETFRLMIGSEPAETFIPFGKIVTEGIKVTTNQIKDSGDLRYDKKTDKLGLERMEFIISSGNKLYLSDIIPNKAVNGSTGQLLTPSGGVPEDRYFATGMIPRGADAFGNLDTHLIATYMHQVAFYTGSDRANFLTGGSILDYNVKIPWPDNATHFSCGILSTLRSQAMIFSGTEEVTLPEKYIGNNMLKDVSVAEADSFARKDEILLLDFPEICVVVGHTVEIYNSQVAWTGNVNNYHFFWSGLGKSMKRKWQLTAPASLIGERNLSLIVYNNNMEVVANKVYKIIVVPNDIPTPFSVVAIGDSLTNAKRWLPLIQELSNNKIKMVGSRWGNGNPNQGYLHEGRSGWAAAHYVANSTYTFDSGGYPGADGRGQQYNPFFNPRAGQIDWMYYITNYMNGVQPDKVDITLGGNQISIDPTVNANHIKNFVLGLRATGCTQTIFVTDTIYRGDQDGIANQTGSDGYSVTQSWKLQEDRKVFNLHNKLVELLKGLENVHFITIAATHDSEYNFTPDPATAAPPWNRPTPVNQFAWQTYYPPNEGTHPQVAGYTQMGYLKFAHYLAH